MNCFNLYLLKVVKKFNLSEKCKRVTVTQICRGGVTEILCVFCNFAHGMHVYFQEIVNDQFHISN